MGNQKLWMVLIFLGIVLAALGLSVLQGSSGQPAPNPTPPPALKPSKASEFRGISLQIHSSDPNHPYERYISEIAETGANTLCLVVTGWQEHAGSSSIFIDARKTPADQRLVHLMRHARSKGLRVTVMPIILLENPRSGEWRGLIQPKDWNDWWNDYDQVILHYAKLAQRGGAEVFIIGSELIKTETADQAPRWRGLIAKVRKAFTGRLSYSANWDHYRPVSWWDDLDLIGMTTYYDLTGKNEPTLKVLMDKWRAIKTDILVWQAQIKRPILFTEVGWPSQDSGAKYPWNYCHSKTPDLPLQQRCFEAFFRTWIDEPAVAGYLVWEWRNHPGQDPEPRGKYVPQTDVSYIPCGKPAMEVIRHYYQHPGPGGGGPADDANAAPAAG